MTKINEKIKARIMQLLAIATNAASTDGEKRNAMQMATSMMRKHNIERSDVTGDNVDRVEYGKRSCYAVGKRVTTWESSLAAIIGKYLVPTAFAVGTAGTNEIQYIGPVDDAEFACALFHHLSREAAGNGRSRFGGYARGDGAAYCYGFTVGLAESLKTEPAADAENQIAIRRQSVILRGAKNWLADQGVRTAKHSRRANIGNRSAYSAGVEDGRSTETPGRSMTRARIA